MKKVIVLLIGCVPFLIGGLMNWGMTTILINMRFPYLLFGILMLALWAGVAYFLCRSTKNALHTVALLNLPALIVLILLLIQGLILGSYWANFFGLMIQTFYLPVVPIASRLIGFILRRITMEAIFLTTFVLMVGASALGCLLWDRKK